MQIIMCKYGKLGDGYAWAKHHEKKTCNIRRDSWVLCVCFGGACVCVWGGMCL